MLENSELWTCLLIIGGRVADVSIGTVRTLFVVQGRRGLASVLGFFEVTIWIFIVARVINGLGENVLYACSYGLGFALGNFLGVTIEGWLAFGTQALLVFSREGRAMARSLREKGYRLTEFAGRGRDGIVPMLMVVVQRQETLDLVAEIRSVDPDCYYILEDIRQDNAVRGRLHDPTGWRQVMKKK
jgi:uncharacterized protein YebE (UPF0316 family)